MVAHNELEVIEQLAEIKAKLEIISEEHPQCRGQISDVKEAVHLLSERVARAEQDIKSAHDKISEFKKDVLWTISVSMTGCSVLTALVTFIVTHLVNR